MIKNINNIIPKKLYSNPEEIKMLIFKENNNLSGIYRWTNLISGKSYIGSAANLSKRLSKYFLSKHLQKVLLKSKSKILSSLLKYGYANFSLEILEYINLSMVINVELKKKIILEREQYYIDLLKPEYNICKIAGSTLGKKHSLETILKIKSYKHSAETIAKLKAMRTGQKHSDYTKDKISSSLKGRKLKPETIAKIRLATIGKAPSWKSNPFCMAAHITTVINIKENSQKVYSSIREAAKDIGFNHVTVWNYANSGKILNNTYIIKKNK